MAHYVLSFRQPNRQGTADSERAWGEWFERIGDRVADVGHRVGQAQMVGHGSPPPDELSGYVVITADSLEAAAQIAEGCPGLRSGGRVEVGAVMPAE